jgi:hypothetical protein
LCSVSSSAASKVKGRVLFNSMLMVRRLSGGVDVPHRMTPIAEAAPEPKPLPLHVQVAARDVMTGACVLPVGCIQWPNVV